MIVASSAAKFGLELLAAEVLIADQDQHLPGCSFEAGDHLQADEFLVDLRGGERERPGSAVGREQSVQPKAPEVAAVAGAVAVIGNSGNRCTSRLAATARNRGSDGSPMIAWATQRVMISASVIRRRAFPGRLGRKSSAMQ
jgi:hypothetical protein